ncbi:MAG: DUF3592 domain-containing protein, partial [Capsulimonadaceae bacterium]
MAAAAYQTNPPRTVRWTGAKAERILVYGLVLLCGGVLICAVCSNLLATLRYFQSGLQTAATVVAKHESDGKSTQYYLDLEYNTASGPLHNTMWTEQENYNACNTGSVVTITYLPDAPDQPRFGRVTAADVADDQQALVIATIGVVIVGALVVVLCEYALRKEYRLVRDGLLATGRVFEVREVPIKSGTKHI